jgi:hypothetical protein
VLFRSDFRGQVDERARCEVFQHKRLEWRADLQHFPRNAGSDVTANVVGDERDLFPRLNSQAGVHCVVSARRKFSIECSFSEIGQNGLNQDDPFEFEY